MTENSGNLLQNEDMGNLQKIKKYYYLNSYFISIAEKFYFNFLIYSADRYI